MLTPKHRIRIVSEKPKYSTPLTDMDGDMQWCDGAPCDDSRYLFTFADRYGFEQFVKAGDIILRTGDLLEFFPSSDEKRPAPPTVIIEETVHYDPKIIEGEPYRDTATVLAEHKQALVDVTVAYLESIKVDLMEILVHAEPILKRSLLAFTGIYGDIQRDSDDANVSHAYLSLINVMTAISGMVNDDKLRGMRTPIVDWKDVLNKHQKATASFPFPEQDLYL